MPTSSSSSTNTSQTSSSSSVDYSSSSSSGWCKTPNCYGTYCSNFSSWVINGIYDGDGINNLYVILTAFGSEQQIEVYSDPNYFDLIAIGRDVAGTIALSQMNASGVSGTVVWNGTLAPSGSQLLLDCLDASSFSTDSSSSSLDSSSSSSQSKQSESSSTSGCCVAPYSEGAGSANFSSWSFAGMNDHNSNNCSLYVGLDIWNGIYQVVRVYRDAALYNLVAIGQRLNAGTITLSSVLGSGLSGTVTWNGTYVYYPSVVFLSCQEFSSSSSSISSESSTTSSSSFDSSSSSSKDSSSTSTSQSESTSTSSMDSSTSSSSSSFEFSSGSSFSSSSKSSRSSLSTSSSSSQDSSTSSSESEGNVSSSSSSSLEIWNKSKPLLLANSAIYGISIPNKIAQSVVTDELTYDIGKVYAYMFGPYGNVDAATLTMQVSEANNDGTPSSIIATATLNASEIDGDGWYPFEFNVSGTTPSNKTLCYTMFMEGMDEDNYVMWGYSEYGESTNKAYIFVDGQWKLHPYIIRSLKVNGTSELFDLVDYKISSPSGILAHNVPSLGGNSASFVNTEVVVAPERVEISPPDTIVSFVVDASGSMGWNDRFKNRTDFVEEFYSRFSDGYGSNFIFDYIRFGSIVLDTDNFRSSLGRVATINLDVSSPTRTTYTLTLDGQYSAANGSIYSTIDGKTFKVVAGGSYVTTLYVSGEVAPTITSGALTLVSGSGDSPISYSSYVAAKYTDGIIAYGFKNLQDGHTYVLGEVKMDNAMFDDASLVNNSLFYPSSESPSILTASNGPYDSLAVNINATSNTIVRKTLQSFELASAYIQGDILADETNMVVDDSSTLEIGKKYDLVAGDIVSPNHKINAVSGQTITFSPHPYYFVPGKDKANSIVQESMFASPKSITGTTLMLLVKDSLVSGNITFFIQTPQGLPIEWDFMPFEEWLYLNLFWLGSTANFNFNGVDSEGDILPDGTRLDLLVDKEFDIKKEDVTSKTLTRNALTGSDVLYLDNVTGIKRDSKFNLISGSLTQEVSIAEIGSDNGSDYVTIYSVLASNYPIGATLVYQNLSEQGLSAMESSYDSKTEVPLSIVDITPILAGENLDPSLLKDYDGVQVPYNETYANLNLSRDYIRNSVKDIPTINGLAAIRFLPVTEDSFKTVRQKQDEAELILRMDPPSKYASQTRKSTVVVSAPQEDTASVAGTDYAIETPVYFYNGLASSSMTSYATILGDKEFEGLNFPGESSPATIPSKSYKVYPQISIVSETGAIIGKQIIEPLLVDFACPIEIGYSDDNKTVYYWVWIKPSMDDPYQWVKTILPGVYASSNRRSVVRYRLTDELILVKSGQIKIRIYKNTIVNLTGAASSLALAKTNTFFLNEKPSTKTVINSDGTSKVEDVKSDIDTWRDAVSANETPNIGDGTFGWYENPDQWVLDSEVTQNDYFADITNGYVSIDMPSSSATGLYMIEASIDIDGTNLEFVRSAFIFNANPLVPELITPYKNRPITGNEKFELSLEVKWMGGEVYDDDGNIVSTNGIIENGTAVNITPNETNIEPSFSETNNGIASGLLAGTRVPIVCKIPPATSAEDCEEMEWVSVSVAHSTDYSLTVDRNVIWQPNIISSNNINDFFVYTDPVTKEIWADGEDSTIINIDINSDANKDVILDVNGVPVVWVGEYGAQRLMGLDQSNNEPSDISGSSEFTPSSQKWNTSSVSFALLPVNKTIGLEPQGIGGEFFTGYYYVDVNGIAQYNNGHISTSIPTFSEDKGWNYDIPSITIKEPLGIQVEIEYLDRIFPRNGVTSVNVVASLTWKGKAIKSKLVINEGKPNQSVIDYPLPSVSFLAGKCKKPNADDEGNVIDIRAPASACLEIENSSDVLLTEYFVQSSLSRTDIHTDEDGNEHTHSCVVDANGNGTTTGVITISGTVADHTHTIADYVADMADGHGHELRCVAITQIRPTSNTKLDIYVNAKVVYDPTNSEPWDGYGAADEPNTPYGNRKAFNTALSSGYYPSKPELVLEITTGANLKDNQPPENNPINKNSGDVSLQNSVPTFYTSETVDDSSGGFDFKVKAYFSSYVTELVPGVPTTIPTQPVPDGTRLVFSIETFKPPTNKLMGEGDQNGGSDTGNDLVISYNKKRQYLFIKVDVQACVNGMFEDQNVKIMVVSRLQWLPGYKALIEEPTGDEIYKDLALSKVNSLGASQLYDAIRLAAQRSLEYAYDNNLDNYKHVIFVLSDGDENISSVSLKQSINTVNFIDGEKQTPSIASRLGVSSITDHAILKKIAFDTDGFVSGMRDYDQTMIENSVDEIIINDKFPLNSGTYSDTIEFIASASPKLLELLDVTLPTNSSIVFRARTSSDKKTWTTWSEWANWDNPLENLAANQKYIQYEAKLSGNESFNTPSLNQGLSIEYVKPQSAMVYFTPVNLDIQDDEYLSAIHVTQHGSIPSTSTVVYGINMNESVNPDEYSNLYRNWIKPDEYSVILTRVNELISTENYLNYFATNGSWTDGASVEIRRFNAANPNGLLVDPKEYVLSPANGKIDFYVLQSIGDYFTISIYYASSFRLICKIDNYGEEGANIDHIALMYSVMKRFPRDSKGNIVRQPLVKRI